MVNLPKVRADMLPADFKGIAEVLKGKNIQIKALHLHQTKPHVNPNP